MSSTKTLKLACYMTNVSMSVVSNLPPLLFITFLTFYVKDYALLGLLVAVNFSTQLVVDLIFSFFSHKFDIPKVVKFTPLLTIIGLLVYAAAPLFPSVYFGLVLGTVIFSSASGLAEVLISPVIAAIPSDNPEREMSKLHSIYAWGVVFVVLFSAVFFLVFGMAKWQYLTLFFTLIPLGSFLLFLRSDVPEIEKPERVSGALAFLKRKELWLCVFAIFLGGASECTMAQWASGYLEKALGLPKFFGDVFGVALFSVMLGLGRTMYAKHGKNIEKVLFLSAIGATVCYFLAVLSSLPFIGLCACAFTGLFVAMLWPGCLIVSSERIPDGGVFTYAMMAAGGDCGASVLPLAVGLITDGIKGSSFALSASQTIGIGVEQFAMKSGMAVGALFPLIAVFVYLHILKTKKKA